MAVSANIKSLEDIMRKDPGISGDFQYMQQFSWLIFLKIFDSKEQEWELLEENYISVLEPKYQWRNWAVDKKNKEALTGDDLLKFAEELFEYIKNIELTPESDTRKIIFVKAMEDVNNYMKNGIYLRQVLNFLNNIDFNKNAEVHEFGDYYESFLKNLQSASKNSGEFYTPRPITDFMAEMTDPQLGDKIGDFACGTGGFIVSALNRLRTAGAGSLEDLSKYDNSVFGIEKKSVPYIMCCSNLLFHDVTNPNVVLGNTLETNYKEYRKQEKFDIILMNPPFGGKEDEQIQTNFPADFRSGETFDLFLYVIMERLKEGGKCGLILPDGFFFGDGVKQRLKEKLFSEFNVHTIIRLPNSVFAPYTPITTNILFFDRTGKTEETWFYRFDMPQGYKHFSKTKPLTWEHLNPIRDWWNNREEIITDDKPKAKKYTFEEIKERNYNID
ncbi:MAG: SAM-dependent DNA methyltransferase, partial [Armatimonadetes bacterium]|nr:SAM-dependent DNA methyltransferase [Candidatus Hippobium faecium]